MELKTIDDIKKEIGKKVKFGKGDNVSENLKALDVLEGIITKIISSWEHTANGDTCVSWTVNIDVIDPKDGGVHHLSSNRIFTDDTKDIDIVNVRIDDEINKLEERIVVLENSKIFTGIIDEPIGDNSPAFMRG